MSTRSRQSRVGATPSSSRRSVAATPARGTQDALPPYKKPSHPLDGPAQHALRELNGQSLTALKKHNKDAITQIRSSAEGVNDMLSEHQRYFEARSKKWDAGKKLEEKADEEAIYADLKQRVEDATAKLEESMRAVIDSSVAAQRIEDTLEWLRQAAPRQLEEEYESQMTQRQTQRRQTQASDIDSDEDIQMDEGPTPGPTPLTTSIALTGSVDMFLSRMSRETDAYTSQSLTARYARHNDYRDFRRVVHDARYGDEGPVLAHEDTWFNETGEPQLGVTQRRGGAYDNDSDDDLVMDRATISTKCPITFQQLKEPYTSTKCPHTFEKTAILGMIRTSGTRFGPGGSKSVTCPVCDQQLSAADLRVDPIIARKIKRMQLAELEETQLDSDEDDNDDSDTKPMQAPRASHPHGRAGSNMQVPSSQQPPRSSIIEDHGDPSDDDEE
ncbi:hypothetical protein E8E13_003940 [Curvularia kusanoi]|uniref:SP-RING-type domain-containing protein n=1 Tax=Curvularia kusanoi TaxID=90978 RepID=A0A9P4T5Y8_CURKU|nr:hypothetical protein E8E13_003940 [Curvularia kusanoi]